VIFNPHEVSYSEVAKLFFEIHDPTQTLGQGPDLGPQYRSAIFYLTVEQKEEAKRWISLLKRSGYDATTLVLPAGPFYRAEEKHQDYYEKTGSLPYCHRRVNRFV
jgi:methionine-S-sulfoxide reductase